MCGSKQDDLFWTTGFRFIPKKGENGRWTTSLEAHYKNLSLGVDYRPLTQNIGVVASLRLLNESKYKPAIVIGTGPDQFNGVDSQAYFATVSKRLGKPFGISVSPFVGVGHIEKLDETKFIGGIIFRKDNISMQYFHNGFVGHYVASYDFLQRHTLSFVLWGLEQPGLSYTLRF